MRADNRPMKLKPDVTPGHPLEPLAVCVNATWDTSPVSYALLGCAAPDHKRTALPRCALLPSADKQVPPFASCFHPSSQTEKSIAPPLYLRLPTPGARTSNAPSLLSKEPRAHA